MIKSFLLLIKFKVITPFISPRHLSDRLDFIMKSKTKLSFKIRQKEDQFPSDYVFIKNRKFALVVGWWMLIVTAVATVLGIAPQDIT